MVIGCGAVGLAAVQGARLAGAGEIIAVDLDDGKLALAERVGATCRSRCAPRGSQSPSPRRRRSDAASMSSSKPPAAPLRSARSLEAVRPGGEVIWLGKTDVAHDVAFRWGSLMGEKRIRRSSYGGARPARDFPLLARAYLDGKLKLDELISRHIALDEINDGFAALRARRDDPQRRHVLADCLRKQVVSGRNPNQSWPVDPINSFGGRLPPLAVPRGAARRELLEHMTVPVLLSH